jgi:hypothetical protein
MEQLRRGLSLRFSPEPTTRQKVLGFGICVPIPQTSSLQIRQRVGGRRKVSPDFGGLRILPYYCSVAGQTALKGQETVASPFPASANFVSRALLPQNRG